MTLTEFLLARIVELAAMGRKWEAIEEPGWTSAYTLDAESKRLLLDLHADGGESQGYLDTGKYGYLEHCCKTCGSFGEYGEPWPCATVKALGLPYADHPDYREEWRP